MFLGNELSLEEQSRKKPNLLIETNHSSNFKFTQFSNPASQTKCKESNANMKIPNSSSSLFQSNQLHTNFYGNDEKSANNCLDDQSMQFKNSDFAFVDMQPNIETLPNKTPTILDESKTYFMGKIKYFDYNKEFGFIHIENDAKEIFYHYHDVNDNRLSKEVLNLSKVGVTIKVMFKIMNYIGKYDTSRKAIGIRIWELPNV